MKRTSFIVHVVHDENEQIDADKVFDAVFYKLEDSYIDVREFTNDEYLGISGPDKVE